MGRELSAAVKAKLGLSGLFAMESEEATWPDEDVARGREAIPRVSLESLVDRGFRGVHFQELESRAAHRAGLEISLGVGVSRVLRIRRPDEPGIAVRPSQEGPGVVVPDPYDPGTVLVDALRAGPAAAHTTETLHLLLDATEGNLAMTLFSSRIETPQEPLESPLRAWGHTCHDSWLRGEIDARLRQGDSWSHAVAVGLYARLLEEPRPRGEHRSLAELLDDPRIRAPREWGRDLSLGWQAHLEGRGVEEAHALRRRLETLEECPEPEEEAWDRELLDACHVRDDLESVWTLLVQAGSGARLEAALAGIDWQGARLLAAVDPPPVLPDERLRRVGRGLPDAWWARVSTGPHPALDG